MIMKQTFQFIFSFSCLIGFLILLSGSGEVTTIDNHPSAPQNVRGILLQKDYSFAGEALPIDKQDVYERLDRELLVNTFWHSSTMLNIKRSTKYFPLIESILKEEGVPDDFKFLCVAESNLTNAISPAGAKGFWQFLESTGASYGMEIDAYVDERYHLEKATRAACAYLREAKEEFGSWTLAAVSYNMGRHGLKKNLEQQRAQNFYELNLNSETMRYIFRIVALKEIIAHPGKFGIHMEENDYYAPLGAHYDMKVDTTIQDLAVFAERFGVSYRDLKYYNPWLINGKLPNINGKIYAIKIPKRDE